MHHIEHGKWTIYIEVCDSVVIGSLWKDGKRVHSMEDTTPKKVFNQLILLIP
jgi:hypothetical protein